MPDWAKGRLFSPMTHHAPSFIRSPRALAMAAIAVLALLAIIFVARAQVEGDRGIAPIVSSTDIDVAGIEVDVRGDDAEDAREKAWAEAQRLAWERLDGPDISDSQLQGLVSAIVIEQERIGPRRYIGTLGIIFDRARAGRLLGSEGRARGSAPMLLVPVTVSGGTQLVYEMRNPWQRAWAEYQAGSSRIDYVRPSGAGGDSLLITYGQTTRRSRTWWRNILDQFEAADVLVPIADLDYQWPGGPVRGTFTARHGPSSDFLGSFTLTADSPDQLPAMLAQAVRRFDQMFERALAAGTLSPDPTLDIDAPEIDPAIQRLIQMGQAAEAQARSEAARRAAEAASETEEPATTTPDAPAQVVSSYSVQFATPDAAAFDASVAAIRSTPGVRGAATTSTAIGGTSIMTVSYGGSIEELASALRSRGFSVTQGGNSLSVSR